jgi:hypothetical protein
MDIYVMDDELILGGHTNAARKEARKLARAGATIDNEHHGLFYSDYVIILPANSHGARARYLTMRLIARNNHIRIQNWCYWYPSPLRSPSVRRHYIRFIASDATPFATMKMLERLAKTFLEPARVHVYRGINGESRLSLNVVGYPEVIRRRAS